MTKNIYARIVFSKIDFHTCAVIKFVRNRDGKLAAFAKMLIGTHKLACTLCKITQKASNHLQTYTDCFADTDTVVTETLGWMLQSNCLKAHGHIGIRPLPYTHTPHKHAQTQWYWLLVHISNEFLYGTCVHRQFACIFAVVVVGGGVGATVIGFITVFGYITVVPWFVTDCVQNINLGVPYI